MHTDIYALNGLMAPALGYVPKITPTSDSGTEGVPILQLRVSKKLSHIKDMWTV